MQRHLYPALFLITIALAAAVYMRPSVGEELMGLAGGRPGTHEYGGVRAPVESTVAGGAVAPWSTQPLPAPQSVPWPATPIGEAFAGDTPSTPPSSWPSYRQPPQQVGPYAPGEWWPQPDAGQQPGPPPIGGPVPQPSGPYYPIAGSGREDRQPGVRQPDAGQSAPYAGQADYPPRGSQPLAPDAQLGGGPPRIGAAKPCEGARVLARVGNEVILASEVMPAYEETVARVPQSELARFSERQLETQKKALILNLLQGHIETKLIYQDAQRNIPAEGLPAMEGKIGDYFEKDELPKRIQKAGVGSRRELDEKLQSIGSSLERTKRAFIQHVLAMQWMRQQNDFDPDVSHDDMLDYYQQHLADFETQGRARWEEMRVRIPRYSDGSEAQAKLAQMGNQVMQGIPMTDVLKAQSGATPECRGGVQDWTTKGSLEGSQVVEEAVFGLPVGRLSRILQDKDEFYIVRVLEREEARRTPFEEAQVEIREKIQELRRQKEIHAYLARLREQIPVWTVFDGDPDLAQLRRQSDPSGN